MFNNSGPSMNLDTLDVLCQYCDDREKFVKAIYRRHKVRIAPRAQRSGEVKILMRNGVDQSRSAEEQFFL